MCFDLDSSPPIPVIAGAAVSHDDLELEAADGNRFAAFAAHPDGPVSTGIVILPDVRGLYRFYEELALRFAERGFLAIAFDYFGRTAGVSKRDDDFPYMEHTALTTPEGIQADVGAAVAYLRGEGADPIFTVGFCFGGRNSWLSAAGGHGLAGAVGFYGMPGERNGLPGPTQRAAELAAPILALQAGDDANITAGAQRGLRRGPDRSRRRPRARRPTRARPHSFFDRKYEDYADASADAWQRTLAFIDGELLDEGPQPLKGSRIRTALASWSCCTLKE